MNERSLEHALADSLKSRKRVSRPASVMTDEVQTACAPHLATGARGEELAAELLRGEGMTIIGRNVREGHCEMDIVAQDGDEVVFAEVRTRTDNKFMSPEDSVGPQKLKKLVRAGRLWTERLGYNGFWRIDLVAVTMADGEPPRIEHYKSITEPLA